MNNNISPANNINFQAKLDITKVKGSKHRWQNIARMFEEKTQKYSSDVFLLEGSFKNGLDLNITNNGLLSFEEATIADFASTKLKKLTDNDIVKNLVDIFKHLKKEEAIIEKQNQWAKTLKLDHLDATQNKNLTEQFHNLMAEISFAEKADFIKKHPIFKNDGIII